MYKSLKLSDLTYDAVIVDANGENLYKLNIGDWFTDNVNANRDSIEFEITCVDITGSGTLKYLESLDRTNWTAVSDGTSAVELTIDDDETHRIKEFTVQPNSWRRFELDEGTLSAGYLIIKYEV